LSNSEPSFDWQNMGDWRLVLPPSRPSADHLSLVDATIQRYPNNARVAVLGSTIEYRELLNRRGFSEVYILEKNLDFFRFMTKISCVELHEKLIIGDWRDTLPDLTGKFDVVLSHLTSGNVDYASRENFYELVASALSHSGVFVDFVLTNEFGYISQDEILARFMTAPVNIATANEFSCLALFCSKYAHELGVVDTSKIYDSLYRDFSKDFHHIIDLSQYVTPRGGLWYYGKSWPDVEGFHSKFLHVEQSVVEPTGSPYHNHARHNVMKSTQSK